jgi:hypothetical protein
VKSSLVNRVRWSALKISRVPYSAITYLSASKQKSLVLVIDTRLASTLRAGPVNDGDLANRIGCLLRKTRIEPPDFHAHVERFSRQPPVYLFDPAGVSRPPGQVTAHAVHANKKGRLRAPGFSATRSSRGDYFAFLRIAAKPAIPRSAASKTIAHSESVGMPRAEPAPNAAQVGTVILFAASVTVPPFDRALPFKYAKFPMVIPASSMIFPSNVGAAGGIPPMVYAPMLVAPAGAQ